MAALPPFLDASFLSLGVEFQRLMILSLGVRYSTSGLAISANRSAIRPPAKTAGGAREARPRCFVDEGVVLLIDLC